MGKRKVADSWVLHMSDEQMMQKEITMQLLAYHQKEDKRVFRTQCCTYETQSHDSETKLK
jgi:hypothetical protein